MHEAYLHEAWTHTASVMWLLAEIHRDRKKQRTPYRLSDFHPLMRTTPRGTPFTGSLLRARWRRYQARQRRKRD